MSDKSAKNSKVLQAAAKKRPPNAGKGRVKGVPNKATKNAREAIARFVDGNADKLERWLDAIEQEDGAKAALECFAKLLDYHVPKLARTELSGTDGGPLQVIVQRFTEVGE
ncbi:MAG: hypothetical protein Q4B94_04505 [Pseudomonadota bacterium]|nr:hypothetical protein [Pseudomonadota bacterium]